LHRIPQGCFRFHTLKHSVATIIANRVQNIFTLKNHFGTCIHLIVDVLRTP